MKAEKRGNRIHRILNGPRLGGKKPNAGGVNKQKVETGWWDRKSRSRVPRGRPSPKQELKRCSLHNPAGATRLKDNRTSFNRLDQVIILHGPWRPQSKDVNLSAVWEERNATELGRPKR